MQFNTMSHELIAHCLHHQVIPLTINDTYLEIAAQQNHSANLESSLRFVCQRQIKINYWPESKIAETLRIMQEYQKNNTLFMTQQKQDDEIIVLINKLLEQAIQYRASDIHFEPYVTQYRIRIRIDGVLKLLLSQSISLANPITVRLKILSNLNIAEKRLPQDGQLTYQYNNNNYSFRISVLPVIHGEKIVLRLLSSAEQQLDIELLGLPPPLLTHYQHYLNYSQGLILVTGPTGSGKTATLYSGLTYLNNGVRNICSIEDPIEIPLDGINQTNVKTKIGLTFSTTLRALLRQDPDVLMIGEIRDSETAEIAIAAAQTGHLVLSTLHTNSTTETLTRLKQMKTSTYLLASTLKIIISQRLVRKLCIHCRQQSTKEIILTMNGLEETLPDWQESSCEHCVGGYHQRTGIYEMLINTPEIQQAILNDASSMVLRTIALKQGMLTLIQQGCILIRQGVTSFSELKRVLDYDTIE